MRLLPHIHLTGSLLLSFNKFRSVTVIFHSFRILNTVKHYLYNFLFLCLLTLFCALTAVLVFQVSFFISKNRILVLAFAFLINNLIYILAGLFSDLDIRPYAYLFSLDTSPTKRLWFLTLLFAVMLIAAGCLTPVCIRKLQETEGQ